MKKLGAHKYSSYPSPLSVDSTSGSDTLFHSLWSQNEPEIKLLFDSLYENHIAAELAWQSLQEVIFKAMTNRSFDLKKRDADKASKDGWFLSNQLAGMSLYVDRFAQDLQHLPSKLDYVQDLGINLLHLMPVFQSPPDESDGGYAVSDFRQVDAKFGSIDDLNTVITNMHHRGMYVMLDIVLNHTSHYHDWAQKARSGDPLYQSYYYMYDDRTIPDRFNQTMPEIFPESAPGNFTYLEDCDKWVMTVFHQYQWDLNFSNPRVLVEMLDIIFFYANLGVDILRIDAPAFIWKQVGTNCQNLPQAHQILRLIKHSVKIGTPGMALLGEAIVCPSEIMKYFGTDEYKARECDFAYNATMMALQWDALATGQTSILRDTQKELLTKPNGTSWISYTRCHDDIGLGFSDENIRQSGFDPFEHRSFLKEYYSGSYPDSHAVGALFSVNPKTNDARISGTLASLCGLEKAILANDPKHTQIAIQKIILMQGHSFFIGGLPMLFYGDEVGYTNDYSYLDDPGKSYDNRWMHRPLLDWNKNGLIHHPDTIEHSLFNATKKLLVIRKLLPAISDHKNIEWLPDENIHVSAFVRWDDRQKVYCLFNFGAYPVYVSWYLLKKHAQQGDSLYDHWADRVLIIGPDQEHIIIPAYGILIAS